jgi:hypothetical protein
MYRSFRWTLFVAATLAVAVLVALFGLATHSSAQTVRDDEVILLTATGQIRVDDPYTPSGYRPAVWDSGLDTGWALVAAGDFNGDGDAEIVAAKSDIIKVFDPIQQPGRTLVSFYRAFGSGRTIRLIVTGDFDADGKAEIAVTHADSGGDIQETLKLYDGGANATESEWILVRNESFGAMWQDMAAGDINADGADDLTLVRTSSNLIKAYNGRTWAVLAEASYNFPWIALATGNLTANYAGQELALTRGEVLAYHDSVILLRLSGNSFLDVATGYKFYPYFASVATGDLNGDGDDEVLVLRDPSANSTSLLMINPAGAAIRPFEQVIGYGTSAWKLVRLGDTDGDGLDEIVVLRGDRYRIYTDPHANDLYTDYPGNYKTIATTSNLPTMAVADIDGQGILQGPILSVTPLTQSFDLEYGQTSPTKVFTITNTGTATSISWQAQIITATASGWLQLNNTTGTTPGTLNVSVNSQAVAPGSYSATVRITATSGGDVTNSPQDVTVSLTLRGLAMVVSPTELNFEVGYGQTSPTRQITVTSAGGSGAIRWQASVIQGNQWLIVSPLQGTSPSTLSVRINTLAVTPGVLPGTIFVEALDSGVTNPFAYVTVRVTVTDTGLVVTPGQLTFRQKISGPPQTGTVSVQRPGWATPWAAALLPAQAAAMLAEKLAGGEIAIGAGELTLDGAPLSPPTWLSLGPDEGRTPATITLTMSATDPGIYRAILVVVASDPATPNRVHVVDITGYAEVVGYMPMILQ